MMNSFMSALVAFSGMPSVMKEHFVHHKDASLLNIYIEKDSSIKMDYSLSKSYSVLQSFTVFFSGYIQVEILPNKQQ